MATRRKRRYIDADVEAAIQDAAIDTDWSPAQIHARLVWREDLRGRVPTVRTVQRLVAELRTSDTSGVWSLVDASGEDARLVLETLARVIESTAGRIRAISKAEAAWIVKLAHAAPELPPLARWRIGRLYLARETRGEQTGDLDALLALSPWSDDGDGWDRYKRALEGRWVEAAPYFIVGALLREEIGEPSPEEIESLEGAELSAELRAKTKRMMKKYGIKE